MSRIPVRKSTATFKEKRSEFVGILLPQDAIAEVASNVKTIRKSHPKARHVCWAYRIANREDIVENSSDAGEPSGTAGAPMLNTLRRHDLLQTLLVVVRYFGGVKLGKRGLTEAYRQAGESAIAEARIKTYRPQVILRISAPLKFIGDLSTNLDKFDISILEDKSEQNLQWIIRLPQENRDSFTAFCDQLAQAEIRISTKENGDSGKKNRRGGGVGTTKPRR